MLKCSLQINWLMHNFVPMGHTYGLIYCIAISNSTRFFSWITWHVLMQCVPTKPPHLNVASCRCPARPLLVLPYFPEINALCICEARGLQYTLCVYPLNTATGFLLSLELTGFSGTAFFLKFPLIFATRWPFCNL